MCGIVGIINGEASRKTDFSYPKLLEQAMQCNSLRGDDSTGVVQLDGKKLYVHKKAVPGWDFAKDDKVSGFLRDADTSNFTLVHNRAATAGLITDEQAHPFTLTNADGKMLIGVHNGTLQGWDSKAYGVDSEWALAQIAERGNEAFADFNGAFAFVWYDQSMAGVLNMARNAERPMYVGYIKDSKRAIFGSEPDMLAWLCRRNAITLEPDIIDLTAGRRYQFNINNPREFTSEPVPQYVSTYTKTSTYTNWHFPKKVPDNKTVEYDGSKYTQAGCIAGFMKILAKPAVEASVLLPDRPGVKVRMKVQVSVAEEILAKHAGVLGVEGVFMGDVYDSESRTLWGEVEVDGESAAGVMRGVSPGFNKYLQKQGTVVVSIIGSFAQPSKYGVQEMAMVVQQKIGKPTTNADAIADAVSSEIDNIRRNAALS